MSRRPRHYLPPTPLPSPKEIVAGSAEEAVRAAEIIGYPVVVKALSEKLLHKSDVGGLVLDVANADGVRAACRKITANVEECVGIRIETFLVCEQIKGGVELALGLHRDPEMGLLLMVGTGGLLLELMADVAFAAPPVSKEAALALLEKLKVGADLARLSWRPNA